MRGLGTSDGSFTKKHRSIGSAVCGLFVSVAAFADVVLPHSRECLIADRALQVMYRVCGAISSESFALENARLWDYSGERSLGSLSESRHLKLRFSFFATPCKPAIYGSALQAHASWPER